MLLQYKGATILDIFRARALIEPELVRSIALSRQPALLAELAGCAASQRFLTDNVVGYKKEELRFRALLIEHSTNVTLSNLALVLSDLVEEMLLAIPKIPESSQTLADLRRGVRAKERLLGLIESGRDLEAAAAWRAYLDDYAGHILIHVEAMQAPVRRRRKPD